MSILLFPAGLITLSIVLLFLTREKGKKERYEQYNNNRLQ